MNSKSSYSSQLTRPTDIAIQKWSQLIRTHPATKYHIVVLLWERLVRECILYRICHFGIYSLVVYGRSRGSFNYIFVHNQQCNLGFAVMMKLYERVLSEQVYQEVSKEL